MRIGRLINAILLTATLATLQACSSKSESVTRKDCERLRDRLIELRMQSVTADHDQHRDALRAGLGEPFMSSCLAAMTNDQLRCAEAATDADSLAACSAPSAD